MIFILRKENSNGFTWRRFITKTKEWCSNLNKEEGALVFVDEADAEIVIKISVNNHWYILLNEQTIWTIYEI